MFESDLFSGFGFNGFEMVVVIGILLYAAYKLYVSVITRDTASLKFLLPAAAIIFAMLYDGENWPVFLQLGAGVVVVCLLYKGYMVLNGVSQSKKKAGA